MDAKLADSKGKARSADCLTIDGYDLWVSHVGLIAVYVKHGIKASVLFSAEEACNGSVAIVEGERDGKTRAAVGL